MAPVQSSMTANTAMPAATLHAAVALLDLSRGTTQSSAPPAAVKSSADHNTTFDLRLTQIKSRIEYIESKRHELRQQNRLTPHILLAMNREMSKINTFLDVMALQEKRHRLQQQRVESNAAAAAAAAAELVRASTAYVKPAAQNDNILRTIGLSTSNNIATIEATTGSTQVENIAPANNTGTPTTPAYPALERIGSALFRGDTLYSLPVFRMAPTASAAFKTSLSTKYLRDNDNKIIRHTTKVTTSNGVKDLLCTAITTNGPGPLFLLAVAEVSKTPINASNSNPLGLALLPNVPTTIQGEVVQAYRTTPKTPTAYLKSLIKHAVRGADAKLRFFPLTERNAAGGVDRLVLHLRANMRCANGKEVVVYMSTGMGKPTRKEIVEVGDAKRKRNGDGSTEDDAPAEKKMKRN